MVNAVPRPNHRFLSPFAPRGKSRSIAGMLSLFLGGLGAGRFYLEYPNNTALIR
ncbi:NINE protein [Mycobacterium sp. NPDC003449]